MWTMKSSKMFLYLKNSQVKDLWSLIISVSKFNQFSQFLVKFFESYTAGLVHRVEFDSFELKLVYSFSRLWVDIYHWLKLTSSCTELADKATIITIIKVCNKIAKAQTVVHPPLKPNPTQKYVSKQIMTIWNSNMFLLKKRNENSINPSLCNGSQIL